MLRTAIVAVFFIFASGGCSGDKAKEPGAKPPAETPEEKAKKLKNMPLQQALKTKYKSILFTCDYSFSVTRPVDGGGSHSYSHQEGLLVWDVLGDYTRERWFDFDYDFENVESNFQFKMTLSLEDITTTRRNKDGREQAVTLRNAVTAAGEVQMRIIEKSLKSGQVEFEIGRGPEAKVFYDRISRDLIISSFGPSDDPKRHTDIAVYCGLDAEVFPEYDSDFKVSQ